MPIDRPGLAGPIARCLLLAGALLPSAKPAAAAANIDLDGPGWTFKTNLEAKALAVSVPHCWPADPNYAHFVGDAIYERDFPAPPTSPGTIVRLHFAAVYYKASVWLNGE